MAVWLLSCAAGAFVGSLVALVILCESWPPFDALGLVPYFGTCGTAFVALLMGPVIVYLLQSLPLWAKLLLCFSVAAYLTGIVTFVATISLYGG